MSRFQDISHKRHRYGPNEIVYDSMEQMALNMARFKSSNPNIKYGIYLIEYIALRNMNFE